MRFFIERTSGHEPPCEGASPATRSFGKQALVAWVVEINSLDELRHLDKRTGGHGLIVNFGRQPSIEIYDGYRE